MSREERRNGPQPPSYLFAAMVLMALFHMLLPLVKYGHTPWTLLGLIPLLAGVVLNLSADRAFKQAGTTVKPFERSSALITHGVFRFSRHPMYLGMTLILVGLAVLLGTLGPLFAVFLFALLMERRFIRVEEQMLAEQFGAAWRDYRASVRRWL